MKIPTSRPEQRIAKLLARAGVASRREIERMIADGRVAVGGAVIDTPATLLTSLHGVTVDGQPVAAAEPARLFRYHKPAGLLTAERDPAGRPTIYDRLPRDLPRVMPVGRLDLNTEGLLLLTTDGELKRQLELPSTGVTRSYRARAFGDISQEQLEDLIHGIEIEGIRYGSIDANLERRTGRNQWIEMRLTEGKNREVRRVLEHFGLQVSRLIRTAYGPFPLADLPPGSVEEIRQHDLVAFRNSLKGGRAMAMPDAPAHERASTWSSPIRPIAAAPARRPDRAPRPPSPSPLAGEGRGEGRAVSAAHKARPPRQGYPAPAASRPARPAPAHAAPRQDRQTPRARPPRQAHPTPAPARPPRPAPARAAPRDDREAPRARPPRPSAAAKPAGKAQAAPEAAASDKPARPKRGAGWAKAKPRPSSRPTRRGTAKRQPTSGRPGGGKK